MQESDRMSEERVERQAVMLENRLRKNERRLRSWRQRGEVEVWRLYDRDIPELPLSVDVYGEHAVVHHWRRRDEDPDAAPGWLERMVEVVGTVLKVPLTQVHVRVRQRQRGSSQYERQGDEGSEVVVREGGLRFLVNLSDYLDTGLFPDLRRGRALVRAEAEGRRFLNLFAYTGAFTVYAAAGGAVRTTTVDLSRRYLDWARRNLELNGLVGERHELIRQDVSAFLEAARRQGRQWDLVVVDPPTFSNSKEMKESFDVQGHHVELLRAVASVLAPGGAIWFSTNFRSFELEASALPELRAVERSADTQAFDFARDAQHRSWRLELL